MTLIKIIQGIREIGGNCIRIEDKDRTLLFDQGIRFSRLNKYYSHRIEPRGIPELRRLGIIPPKEVYQDVSAIYITHFHLDHLGLLANIPGRIVVKLPSLEMFRVIERWYRMSPTWMAYIPPRYTTEIQDAVPLRTDENNVMAIPVEHSIYPAYAYMYFGSDRTILYTGDLRVTSILNPKLHRELYQTTLLRFLEEHQDVHIDNLIIEGTNLGIPITPLNAKYLRETLTELMKQRGMITIAIHNQEIESALLIAEKAAEIDREIIIASNRIAEILDFWLNRLSIKTIGDAGIHTLSSIIEAPLRNLDLIEESSMEKNPEDYIILADLWHMMDFLRAMDPEKIPPESTAILLTSEPQEEEAIYNEALILRWLMRLNLQPYRLRVSGHYYPYQLKMIVRMVKPKEITPIHTLYPEQLYTLVASEGSPN